MTGISLLRGALQDLERHVVYESDADIHAELYELLKMLVNSTEAHHGLLRADALPAAMSRADALKAARDHVESMSTNSRGYQDGVKFGDKVAAIEGFARFLLGESE